MDLNTTRRLNNGVEMPMMGLGVFRSQDGQETVDAVRWALEAGYRHIDTAASYGNEESVGAVVAGLDGGWGPLLEQPAVAFLRTGRAAALEKAMDDYLLGLTRPYRHDPFSVVPVVGYLLARESEARNIRMILVGKANGAPREALEERLRDPYA